MKKVSLILVVFLLIVVSGFYLVPSIQYLESEPQVGFPMDLIASEPQVGYPMNLIASEPQVGYPMNLIA